MICTAWNPRTLALLVCASLTPACADDGGQTDDSGTETSPTSTDSTMTAPSTTASTTDPSTSTDPTGTEESTATGETAESGSTGPAGCSVTPGAWSAPNWEKNTAAEATLRSGLSDLVGLMSSAEAEDPKVLPLVLKDLTTQYMAGDPSVASITSPGYQPILDGAFAEFVDVIEAGEQSLMDVTAWDPGPDGGIWGDSDRGINEGGLELKQLVDKGLFSAGAFYHHAVLMTEGTIDEATIDRIAYIWGNNAGLDPMDKSAELDDGASYSHQQGFHAAMATSLTAAKFYAADETCTAERDAALHEFFVGWETSMMSRLVYYMAETALALSSAETETDFANALHELGEGIGLGAGFYGLPDPEAGPLAGGGRTITDADLDMMLGSLGVDIADLGNSSTGLFVESLPNFETAQGEVEGVLMDVYGVDAATIASWRAPTPG